MHLKRIELLGFKTFAARTVLELRPGITAIVGPNGTGKSNIADAVRWALGETNPRAVRCRSSDELIFAGGARRASLGLAEVSLVFANEGGWLDLPFSEVRVTRRVYRAGENEYLLNGTRVRLRDVVDLLAGASIHAGGHVVVGQGLVDAVLAMRAEERRLLVENLAGLKQYYLRRDDAEGRLAATEANLTQVDGLIAELQPQVERLAEQAATLVRHREASAELHALQATLFAAQSARLNTRLAQTSVLARTAAEALAAGQRQAVEARAEEDRLHAEVGGVQARLEPLRVRVQELTTARTVLERQREVLAARLAAAATREQEAAEDVARLAARAQDLQASLSAAVTEETAAQQALATSAAPLQAARQAWEQAASARAGALNAHRLAETELDTALRGVARLEAAVAAAEAGVQGFGVELARQEAALQSTQTAMAAAEQSRAQAAQAVESAASLRTQAAAREGEARRALDVARRAEAQALQSRQERHRRLDAQATRRDALREWSRRLEGYGEGVRRLAGSPLTVGVVSQLLHIAQEWRPGIVAYLGGVLEAVVTTDIEPLLHAYRAGQIQGQVRALALDAPDHQAHAGIPADLDQVMAARGLDPAAVAGWAASAVVTASHPALLQALGLDRVLLLTTSTALPAARRVLPVLGLGAVTRDGLALLQDGTIVLGTDERALNELQRRDDLEALEAQIATETDLLAEADRTLAEAQHTARQAAAQHGTLSRAMGEREKALARARDEIRFQERVLARARQDRDAAAPACEAARRELAARQAKYAEDSRRLGTAREVAEAADAGREQARNRLEAAENRLVTLNEETRDQERALATLRDRVRAATTLMQERTRQLESAMSDLGRRTSERDRAARDRQALESQLQEVTGQEQVAVKALTLASAELGPLEQHLAQSGEQMRQIHAAARAAADRLQELERAHAAARRDLDLVKRDLDVLRAQVAAELRLTLDDLPVSQPPSGAQARVRALRAQLEEIGPVNPRADVDHAATAERQTFLADQAADLRSGVARLRAIIVEANAAVRRQFTGTVGDLDGHFAAYFSRLFGGGNARLVACYDAEGLPTGMDIQAQPPGKRTRDLALLSGGERALVALSLLFAMLRVRPVPFCLLDEVEAALDEANTGRFGDILRELGAATQMILITHNRGTMLHADHLIGVTSAETGISTVVSMRAPVDQADAVQGVTATIS